MVPTLCLFVFSFKKLVLDDLDVVPHVLKCTYCVFGIDETFVTAIYLFAG